MSKKTLKTEDIIDVLNDKRVFSKFLDKMSTEMSLKLESKFNELSTDLNVKISREVNSKLESKFNELTADLKNKIFNEVNLKLEAKFNELTTELRENLISSTRNITDEKIIQHIEPIHKDLAHIKVRLDDLETKQVQNELIIVGVKANNTATQQQMEINKDLFELVLNHLKFDLDINISPHEINYVYRMYNKSKGEQKTSSIVVNFLSNTKKYEILHKAYTLRKNFSASKIFYNERLTRKNADLFYKTRSLQSINKIHTTWIYKGEVYIRKDPTSKPVKIILEKDLPSPSGSTIPLLTT